MIRVSLGLGSELGFGLGLRVVNMIGVQSINYFICRHKCLVMVRVNTTQNLNPDP